MTASDPWWREAVTYEVYVRSFADASGDGLGDLAGARSRLPYIAGLGVDALWLTPFYPSPDRDAGYDVSDHRAVDPRLGTLDELDALVADAHPLGLKVVVDLVLNHVSTEHSWFRAARAAGPGSPERARFHVRRGRGPDGEGPPTDWPSIFGGPAWTAFGDGDWYLHLFDESQPDVRHDHPDVVADSERTLRFWLDRGVDGVRFDAAGAMWKDQTYPEVPAGWQPGDPAPWSDLPEVHSLFRRWAAVLREYGEDRLGLAEVWAPPATQSPYLRPDELGQAFAIDPLFLRSVGSDAPAWQETIDAHLAAATTHGRLPAWAHGSHDVHRAASRWGPDGALAVLLLMLALPGAVYLFAGDELGLPEVDLPDGAIRDPTFVRSAGVDRGRDGARVPLPWTADGRSFGFSADPADPPWLPQPAGWARRSVESQEADPAAPLHLVRDALRLRRDVWCGASSIVEWLPAPEGVLALRRDEHGPVCLTNLTDRSVPWAGYGADVLLASARDGDLLPPRSTAWLR